MSTVTPRFHNIHVQLSGSNGNVFAIIGRVRKALRAGGVNPEQIDAFTQEVMNATSYDDALMTVMRWVDVS